jgi:hypothetical protein
MVSGVPKEGRYHGKENQEGKADFEAREEDSYKNFAVSVRAKASHRTAEGKFTKIVFKKIGGKDCPRFAVTRLGLIEQV